MKLYFIRLLYALINKSIPAGGIKNPQKISKSIPEGGIKNL